jgi:hypothetical protein
VMTPKDIDLIHQLLAKLKHIRNYHSHIWHKNDCLQFNEGLKKFIETKHEDALYATAIDHPHEVEQYKKVLLKHPLFDKITIAGKEQYMISKDGRAFLLSFFLTRGEMQRLLQQLYGSKRNDELKYRVKHIIYRYYTHRDGAIRNRYNQEEDILTDLPATEQQEILATRQLYKIIGYLNDVPYTAHDPALYPLYIDDSKLGRRSVETIDELVDFCTDHHIFEELNFGCVYNKKEEVKEGYVDLTWVGNESYLVRITQSTLHRLILDVLRLGTETHIIERLKAFRQERELLTLLAEDKLCMLPDFKQEYVIFRHRGDSKFGQLVSDWAFADTHSMNKESKLRDKLFTDSVAEPILLRYSDFYFERDDKPRMDNHFVEMAVKYLIDFEVMSGWEWQVETFQLVTKKDTKTGADKQVNTRVTSFAQVIPSGCRLSISEGGVLVRLHSHPHYKFRVNGHFSG